MTNKIKRTSKGNKNINTPKPRGPKNKLTPKIEEEATREMAKAFNAINKGISWNFKSCVPSPHKVHK
ncbi:MAG: hypothetical protein QMD22_04690 [archaeon]|nr:hypothetical protein [archaeon]